MELSKRGLIAQQELLKTFQIRKNIILHEYIIMPNHVHLLMEITKNNNQCRDVLQNVSTNNLNISTQSYFSSISPKSNSISNNIKMYKSSVTRLINPKTIFFAWQSRFYDELIKDQKQFELIKHYIQNNPTNWQKDKFYK